jgi:2,5-diketo-D-gluconate reductase A
MEKMNYKKGINRREFLQTSAKVTAAAMLTGLGTSRLFGAGMMQGKPVEQIKLNNGVKMPVLGFGTLYLTGEVGEKCVADAIAQGYRLIDTAKVYNNEEAVGVGIKNSGIDRKELFVTSKVWVEDSGYEPAKKAFQTSLDKLG